MDAMGVPIWYIFNQSYMRSPEPPERLYIKKHFTNHMIAYVPERTAKKVSVPREDDLRIGHVECSLCGTPIGYNNRYCHHCGARLLEDE